MRTKLFFPLILSALCGCDGRYDLGNQQNPNGGTSGSAGSSGNSGQATSGGTNANGSAGSAGNGGQRGGSGGASGSAGSANGGNAGSLGGSGASGSAGAGGSPIITGRSPWLMSTSFLSSTSTSTAITLLDLDDPNAQPITLGGGSAHLEPDWGDGFSPDGRWILYRVYDTPNYDLYLTRVGANAGTPTPLGTNAVQNPCHWAPDSQRLACILGSIATDAGTQLVYFDTSGESVGPKITVGPGERDLTFVDADTLVYGSSTDDFSRIRWQDGTLGMPETLHVGGGLIVQRSPDGTRGFLKITDTGTSVGATTGATLVDFTTAATTAVDAHLAFSLAPSFTSGFADKADPATDPASTDYLYYAIDDVSINPVGTDAMEGPARAANPALAFAGRTLVRMRGDRLLVANITDTGVSEALVPGDYQNVNVFALDPTGQFLYFGSWTYDPNSITGEPLEASGQLWLSRLGSSGPETPQLVGSGFAGSTATFSPNGRFLLVSPMDDQYPTALPFLLFDLTTSKLEPTTLDIPFDWAFVNWSPDSTRISLIGGDPATQQRSEYVVDALAPNAAPRLIMSCPPPNSSTLTCASSADFQP